MNRVPSVVFRVAGAAIFLCCGMNRMQAQGPASAPIKEGAPKQEMTKPDPDKQGATKEEKGEDDDNPFAPQPAQPLPAGMTGSDVNDPRFKLTPGL